VSASVSLADIGAIDSATEKKISTMAPNTEEDWLSYFEEGHYVPYSSDRVMMSLVPEGQAVMFSKKQSYLKKFEQFRLTEFDAHVAAIYRGLTQVVPAGLLRLLTWEELQSLVCGESHIDIDYLRSRTRYVNISDTAPEVKMLWTVLESMTMRERRGFLRFVWGRTSLPRPHEPDFFFHIYPLPRPDPDESLPESRTCTISSIALTNHHTR